MGARIAMISDQHFDTSSRWDEHLRIMSWLADDLRAREPDEILLGGDLFERRPNPEEMKAAVDWIRALADIADVTLIQGNHEPAESLYPLGRLRARHDITLFDRPGARRSSWGAVACLPWPRRAELLARLGDVSKEEANQIAHDALQNLLRGLGSELADTEGLRLFLGHVQLRAARVSTGQPLAVGADFELGLEDLALVGADAYLLGHIHRRSPWGELQIGDAPVAYAGSPRRTAYGETEEKSYIWLEYDPTFCGCSQGYARGACPVCENRGKLDMEHVPTPCAPMLLLQDEWGPVDDGEGAPIGWACGDWVLDDAHLQGAEVRFRYNVPSDQRSAARAAAERMRDRLTALGAVVVKLEERVIATTRARSAEVAKAVTTEDQLGAVWSTKRPDLTPERRARLLQKVGELRS